MDNTIQGYKSAANTATTDLSNLQTSAPTMLADLKKNLVGIFAKDNPIMGARDTALQDYLTTNANSRVATLPTNLPMVEGSNLTLSPTQQNAITTARNAAALIPLLGYNNIITNQYGTIGDIIKGAGDIYGSNIEAAKTRASNFIDLYKTAVAEQEAKTKAAAGGGVDLASIIAAISRVLGTETPAAHRPPIESFDQPENTDPLKGSDPNLVNSLGNNDIVLPGGIKIPAVPSNSNNPFSPKPSSNPYITNTPFNLGLNSSGTGLSFPGNIPNSPLSKLGINLNLGGF